MDYGMHRDSDALLENQLQLNFFSQKAGLLYRVRQMTINFKPSPRKKTPLDEYAALFNSRS
jgi:hypothetical protein